LWKHRTRENPRNEVPIPEHQLAETKDGYKEVLNRVVIEELEDAVKEKKNPQSGIATLTHRKTVEIPGIAPTCLDCIKL